MMSGAVYFFVPDRNCLPILQEDEDKDMRSCICWNGECLAQTYSSISHLYGSLRSVADLNSWYCSSSTGPASSCTEMWLKLAEV